MKLKETVPVELRYETIVVEGGKLHIYKTCMKQNTNTEENLRQVLQAHGTSLENLSDRERTAVLNALKSVSKKKEVVVAIPSLAEKGYPAPVELDSGTVRTLRPLSEDSGFTRIKTGASSMGAPASP